jgi:hypothetical protein
MRITVHSQILASAVLALAALATHPVMAQSRLNVPFSFVAAGKIYPAGAYTVTRDRNFGTVVLHGENGGVSSLANPSGDAKDNTKISLKFDRIGRFYYLRTMQAGQLVTPRLDSKIKETIPGPEVSLLER